MAAGYSDFAIFCQKRPGIKKFPKGEPLQSNSRRLAPWVNGKLPVLSNFTGLYISFFFYCVSCYSRPHHHRRVFQLPSIHLCTAPSPFAGVPGELQGAIRGVVVLTSPHPRPAVHGATNGRADWSVPYLYYFLSFLLTLHPPSPAMMAIEPARSAPLIPLMTATISRAVMHSIAMMVTMDIFEII
ncbi:hypothetical protein ES705_27712 [subsurface metagenome]